MAQAAKPVKGTMSAAAAEVIEDLGPSKFEASAVTIQAGTKGGLGTVAHAVQRVAREGLIAQGFKPPVGLTLRADHGEVTVNEDGTASRTVTFYYGDPVTKGKHPTDPAYIGQAEAPAIT